MLSLLGKNQTALDVVSLRGRRGDRSRVQIPAARFSEFGEIFFGLKMFAETAGFWRFFSSRGVRYG